MSPLPAAMIHLLSPFAVLFDARTWKKAQLLLAGAILAPRKRTVTSALRSVGLEGALDFSLYHHVLNRASWAPRQLSRVLLSLLLRHLDSGTGPLVFGIDETLERRRGARIQAKGIYRDPVRSSRSHFVKASGLRWICLMWLAWIPWAHRFWALPFLTALAPSERYYREQGKAPKNLTHWAQQLILQLRRWLPDRALVLVADSSYAVLALLHFCQALPQPVTVITRLRLDAALYEPAPPRQPGQRGRPRRKGERLPSLQQRLHDEEAVWESLTVTWYERAPRCVEVLSGTAVWYHPGQPVVPLRWVLVRDPRGRFEPQALLCTDPSVPPTQVINWFVLRWQLEVTFRETRAHLGVETQRQWSPKAIARTTPTLLGLFSWITLVAHLLHPSQDLAPRGAAWYSKPTPTFSDALALVRQQLWHSWGDSALSPDENDMIKIPRALYDQLVGSLAYAA